MYIQDAGALLKRLAGEISEASWLEFKQNDCEPDAIGACVSACANAAILAHKDRAFIVFGVENGTRRLAGTDVRLQRKKKGGENFLNWLNRLLEPRLPIEALDFEIDGRAFAILAIEPTYDRPVRFAGIEYIRIGENTRKLAEFPEHERALWIATGRRKFESAVALAHRTEAEVFELLDSSAYCRLSRQTVSRKRAEILRRFLAAELIREDFEGGYDITNLGAVLLANDITSFPSISAKSVRVIKYDGCDKRRGLTEFEGHKGYAVGFEGLLKFVLQNIPHREAYDSGVRVSVPTYPEVVLREFISNALIHQDFTVPGAGPIVEIYDNRIEITNPGNSLIQVDRIIDERRSRNEKLAREMRSLGLCEERGGGVDKAIIEIEENSLPAPEFIASQDSMRVVVFGPKKFGQLSKAEKTWACFCHCVIRWLQNDYMSNTTLRERFSLTEVDYQAVSAVISDARRQRRIAPADPGQGKRNAKYVPYWAATDSPGVYSPEAPPQSTSEKAKRTEPEADDRQTF